jgi:hypothetical protein
MGISVWYFVRPRPGKFRALSARAADQFFANAGGRIAPDADGLVRYAQVCVDMENRRAVALRRVDFLQTRANEDGSIDRDFEHKVMHEVVPVAMGGLLPSSSPGGVIDAEPQFAKRRLDHMTKWTPTNKDIEALRRVMNHKAGRDIA